MNTYQKSSKNLSKNPNFPQNPKIQEEIMNTYQDSRRNEEYLQKNSKSLSKNPNFLKNPMIQEKMKNTYKKIEKSRWTLGKPSVTLSNPRWALGEPSVNSQWTLGEPSVTLGNPRWPSLSQVFRFGPVGFCFWGQFWDGERRKMSVGWKLIEFGGFWCFSSGLEESLTDPVKRIDIMDKIDRI